MFRSVGTNSGSSRAHPLPTTGAGTDGGSEAGTDGGVDSASGSGTGGADGDDGCGCAQGDPRGGALSLLGLALVGLGRRRRR